MTLFRRSTTRLLLPLTAAIAAAATGMLSCGDDGGPVGPAAETPRPPSHVQVVSTSPGEIVLAWRDNTIDETGFRIERAAGEETGFAVLDTVPRNTTVYHDLSVASGESYSYRVRAYVHSLESDPDGTVRGIAAADQPPIAPSNPYPGVDAFDVGEGGLTLSWDGGDPDTEDSLTYDVAFGRAPNQMASIASGVTEETAAVPAPVMPNAHYYWQVVARDSKGAMRYGPVWSFRTRVDRVSIEGGWLVMGDDLEFVHPGNPVSVQAFEIDRYEVTAQQYADFLNRALRAGPPQVSLRGGRVLDASGQVLLAETQERDSDSQIAYDPIDSLFVALPGRESFPVTEVTWYGAKEYARSLGRRLPTEAEWEFAAKGNGTEEGERVFEVRLPDDEVAVVHVGVGRTYPWGEEADARRANYQGSGDPFEGQKRVETTPIGFFDGRSHGGFATEDGSSPFGVHDMGGNVWEWTEDWVGPYTSPHDPPEGGALKAIRGGAWNRGVASMQTSRRAGADPTTADQAIGFRTAASR